MVLVLVCVGLGISVNVCWVRGVVLMVLTHGVGGVVLMLTLMVVVLMVDGFGVDGGVEVLAQSMDFPSFLMTKNSFPKRGMADFFFFLDSSNT